MNPEIKPWYTICRPTDGSHVEEGVIIHVDDTVGYFWWIPNPQRDKHGKRSKHHIKAPCRQLTVTLQQRLDAQDAFLVPSEPKGLKALSVADLEAMVSKPDEKECRNLKRSLDVMHEHWSWISPLVEGNSIDTLLNGEVVNAYARKRQKVSGVPAGKIVRAVRAYLMGGIRIQALLPGWDRSGALGRPHYPSVNDAAECTARQGRRNIAVKAGHTEMVGILATKDVREKLRNGWKKYKTGRHVSVETAYALTLGEFWAETVISTDSVRTVKLKPLGQLPTFDQFRRHGPGVEPDQSATRINIGQHRWDRDHRPLSGTSRDGLVAAAQCGLIDATSDDQNLVLGIDRTVAMPSSSNTKVVEAYTGYFLGFYSGFERPSTMTSLLAIAHAADSKVKFCERFGITITEEDWLALHLRRIRGDNGEHKSEAGIASITSAQVSLEFVKSYAAEMKGPVESKHQVLHRASGHQMAGSTQGRHHTRGDSLPEKDACRTHDEYMYHAIKAILFHNNTERVEHLLTLEMREEKVEPTRKAILLWMIKKGYVSTESPNMAVIRKACLPTVKGTVTRWGVRIFDPRPKEERLVPHLRYNSPALQASGLTNQGKNFSQEVQVHINPSGIGKAWLYFKGLIEIDLVTHDSQLSNLTLREWLVITDEEKLARFMAKGQRLQILANDGIERYDSNKKARKIKRQHQATAKTEGRTGRNRTSKIEAGKIALDDEKRLQLGLNDMPDDDEREEICNKETSKSANEPEWVTKARADSK